MHQEIEKERAERERLLKQKEKEIERERAEKERLMKQKDQENEELKNKLSRTSLTQVIWKGEDWMTRRKFRWLDLMLNPNLFKEEIFLFSFWRN